MNDGKELARYLQAAWEAYDRDVDPGYALRRYVPDVPAAGFARLAAELLAARAAKAGNEFGWLEGR